MSPRTRTRLRKFATGLSLVILAVMTVFALLALFPAPIEFLWMPAIAATEAGHFLALAALIPIAFGVRGHLGKTRLVLSLVNAALLLSPAVRASVLSDEVAHKVTNAFGTAQPFSSADAPARRQPFSWGSLLSVASPSTSVTTVTYAKRSNVELKLDIYRRAGTGQVEPVLVMIHGGSWRGGYRAQLPAINHYFATRGFAVVTPSYRLAPEHRYPAAYDDMQAAIAYLKANAAKHQLDASQIVLAGRSAGGHLALLTGYRKQDPAVKGVIALYPIADLLWSHAHPANPLVYDTHVTLEQFLGGKPTDVPKRYKQAAPYEHASATSPPTLLIHGGRDELVPADQSQRLAARLTKFKVRHMLLALPWATHACDASLTGPCGQMSLYAMERFVASVVRKPAP